MTPLLRGVEIIETDWERAETPTSRMIDRVGNRSCHTAEHDLAHAFRSDRIEPGIGFVNEVGREFTDVGVYGYVIGGDVRVDKSTKARIHLSRLAKTRAQAPHQTAKY